MSEYKHGEMDISAQKETFERFIRFGIWACVAIAVALIVVAIFGH